MCLGRDACELRVANGIRHETRGAEMHASSLAIAERVSAYISTTKQSHAPGVHNNAPGRASGSRISLGGKTSLVIILTDAINKDGGRTKIDRTAAPLPAVATEIPASLVMTML